MIWIFLLGLVIGAVLGGLGGGGAILTVPVLVYVVGQSGQDAITSSLVIVGLSASVGVLSYVAAKRVRWGLGLTFGLIGIPATFLGAYLNHRVDENLLLLGFSGLMVVAALAMFGNGEPSDNDPNVKEGRRDRSDAAPSGPQSGRQPQSGRTAVLDASSERPSENRPSVLVVAGVALAVGLLTGFFGVGGGFVIVPALVLGLRLPIQHAVGTSLMIVALNSATALASRAGTVKFDWEVIVPFTLAAMLATLVGKRLADRLPARQLKRGFVVLLILVAGYTAWQSVDGLVADQAAESPSASKVSPAPTVFSAPIISPAEVETAIEGGAVALDVRTAAEFKVGHLDGAINIDFQSRDFTELAFTLDRTQTYVVYCASGNRARQAIEMMQPLEFSDLVNGGGFEDIIASTSLPHSQRERAGNRD